MPKIAPGTGVLDTIGTSADASYATGAVTATVEPAKASGGPSGRPGAIPGPCQPQAALLGRPGGPERPPGRSWGHPRPLSAAAALLGRAGGSERPPGRSWRLPAALTRHTGPDGCLGRPWPPAASWPRASPCGCSNGRQAAPRLAGAPKQPCLAEPPGAPSPVRWVLCRPRRRAGTGTRPKPGQVARSARDGRPESRARVRARATPKGSLNHGLKPQAPSRENIDPPNNDGPLAPRSEVEEVEPSAVMVTAHVACWPLRGLQLPRSERVGFQNARRATAARCGAR